MVPPYAANEVVVDWEHPSPDKSDEALLQLKAQAFRAVVQDDVAVLTEVLDEIPVDIWREWKNKGHKDLLTLAQERGRHNAYNVIATRLSLIQVKEMKRVAFKEREAVWIFQ